MPAKREEFDPDRNFVCVKSIIVSGNSFFYGDQFDRKLVTTRRLRQLYESRSLDMLPYQAKSDEETDEPEFIDFSHMPKDAIIMWLHSKGVIPRATWKKAKLVEKANEVFDKLNSTPNTADAVQAAE